MGVLVHAIVDAEGIGALADSDITDVAEQPTRWVPCGDLAALVSDVPDEDVLPSRANLVAHLRVLETAAQATTVLPMRFGVVVPDDETLTADYLVDRREQLARALVRLRHRRELRVHVRYVEDVVVRQVVEHDPTAARLRGASGMDAKMRLGERIAEGISRRRQQDAQPLLAELRPLADDVSVSDVADALDVLVASFLVPDDGLATFDRAVEELRERITPMMSVELVGPLPPFSFTEA